MASERIQFTENELVAALAELGPDTSVAPADAMTAAELRTAMGLSKTAVKERLRALNEAGRLEIWRAIRLDATGRRCSVPAYTIKPAPKAKRGRRL